MLDIYLTGLIVCLVVGAIALGIWILGCWIVEDGLPDFKTVKSFAGLYTFGAVVWPVLVAGLALAASLWIPWFLITGAWEGAQQYIFHKV